MIDPKKREKKRERGGACQNECDAGGTSRLRSKNHVVYSSRVAPLLVRLLLLLLLLLLFVILLPRTLPSRSRLLQVVSSRPWNTWRTRTVLSLCNVQQDALGRRCSSPWSFRVSPTSTTTICHFTSCHQPLSLSLSLSSVTSVFSSTSNGKMVGSINEIICMPCVEKNHLGARRNLLDRRAERVLFLSNCTHYFRLTLALAMRLLTLNVTGRRSGLFTKGTRATVDNARKWLSDNKKGN